MKENLKERKGGVLILDNSLIEKTGRKMAGAGYLYDPSKKKKIFCHDLVSTFYTSNADHIPLYFEPYVKKEAADDAGVLV